VYYTPISVQSAIHNKTDAYVRDVCFDDNRSDSRCDGNGIKGHSANESSIGSFAANDIEPLGAHPGGQCNKF
jgi:hypothetical protein